MSFLRNCLVLATVALTVVGCADTSTVPVQPVTIVSSNFCKIMKAHLSWDVKDTRETINGIRRLNAKFDAQRCAQKPTS